MAQAEPIAVAAVVDVLKAAGLAQGRVFGARLAADQGAHMPRAAVVVRAAGGAGTFGGGDMPTVDDRVDVRCYGPTELEAARLTKRISVVLHRLRDVRTDHGRIIWAKRGGGPLDVTESDTGWPLSLTSWQVFGNWLSEEGL